MHINVCMSTVYIMHVYIFSYVCVFMCAHVTFRAAEFVGLTVHQLMNDNTAVALNYGVFRRQEFNVTPQVCVCVCACACGCVGACVCE